MSSSKQRVLHRGLFCLRFESLGADPSQMLACVSELGGEGIMGNILK